MICLNIGCGSDPIINQIFMDENMINVDITKSPYCHIVCDGHKLPFKDKSFDKVYLSHVLEHMVNPVYALKEFKRVAKQTIHIHVPNKYFFFLIGENKNHMYSWTKTSLTRLLKYVYPQDTIRVKLCFRYIHLSFFERTINKLFSFFQRTELYAIITLQPEGIP